MVVSTYNNLFYTFSYIVIQELEVSPTPSVAKTYHSEAETQGEILLRHNDEDSTKTTATADATSTSVAITDHSQ